jgi:3-hydroxyisobutyrate dehydrogenase-like beta-hydroxyacid dehydrogenase
MSAKHVGLIGLGRMGQPMASNLMKGGYELTVFDVNRQSMETLGGQGARTAASPAEVASAVDTVLLSLPTPPIVREVTLGRDGVSSGARVKTVIDLSTTGATVAREIAAALAKKGMTAVDAPVSGGVAGAVKATLAVMVACARPLYLELEPMLKNIGKVFHIGERPGMGQTMKLCNNLLSATAVAATSEAVVFGVKAGLDPKIMIDVINAGSGRSTATEDKFPRSILPRSFDFGFAMGLMYKDVKLCLEEAEAAGVQMGIASAVGELWQLANQEIGADKDFTELIKVLERRAGVEVKPGRRD